MIRTVSLILLAMLFASADSPADSPTLRERLASGRSVWLPKGVYPISGPLRLTADDQILEGDGPETVILCEAGSDFSAAIEAKGKARLTIRNLTVDCNREARKANLSTRTVGLYLTGCRDLTVDGVTVTGTVGGPVTVGGRNLPGVGIAVGEGYRTSILDCTLTDGGLKEVGKASDGVYVSGDFTTIRGCTAVDCADTGFVLENSNGGLIAQCNTIRCSAGLAITNASSSPKRDNRAEHVTITDWDSRVTGGIQVGLPSDHSTGDLLDTTLSDITMTRLAGRGPAVNLRDVGPGKIDGVTLQGLVIDGAGTQGILCQAERVTVRGSRISDTGASAIQVMPGSRDVAIRRNRIERPTNFGIVAVGPCSDLLIDGNVIDGTPLPSGIGPVPFKMQWGLYLYPGVTDELVMRNAISGWNTGDFGKAPPLPQ